MDTEDLPTPTYSQVRRLECLAHSMGVASDRKRKGLTVHPDEFPALIADLRLAASLMDRARLAALPPAGER
jgi:hypothetical protein